MENEILKQAILDLWDETVNSHKGIYLDEDGNFQLTLAQLNAEQASFPIGPSCATIAAHVEHIIYYLDVLELYALEKPIPKVDWGLIWNTVSSLDKEAWDDERNRLMAAFGRTRKVIGEIDLSRERAIEGVLAILAHTAYHLGQIHQSMCILPGEPRKS
ncbi:MAG TPA: DinB family protein [Anaerolineales bacterium]|nr:DinB family protein [Anaerolineales bacterium]